MGGLYYGLLVALVSLVVLPEEGHGQCPVDPRCTCPPTNNSDITCNNVFKGELPKLSTTDNVFYRFLTVSGYEIYSIANGAFKKLPVTRLTLSRTRISEFECQVFAGLENSLVQLSVYNSRLTSVPSCAIGNLKKLTSFIVDGSRISSIRLKDFSNITWLESLRLTSSYIDKIEPGVFRELTNLTTLSLYNNRIAGLDGFPFRGLTSLKNLYIHYNLISSLPVRTFDELINLQNLDLSNNDLVDLEDSIFLRNRNLITIYLGGNQLSSLPEKIFTGLDKLQTLSASRNRLSDLPLNLFEGCTSLSSLDLSSNLLTYLRPELLRPLIKLRTINLRHNRISGISDNLMDAVMSDVFRHSASIASIDLYNNTLSTLQPGAFRNLTSLTTLRLSQNKLTTIPQGVLTNSSYLSHLSLDHNQIRDISRDFFEQLSPRINTLYLDNNHLLSASVIPLFKRLPSLTGLRSLRLSDTELPPLSTDVLTAMRGLTTELSLRNCSLNGHFSINGSSLPAKTDLSNNNLEGFGKDTQVKVTGNSLTFNVSYNALAELNVNASRGRWVAIYADNNNIRSLTVAATDTVNGETLTLGLRNNQLSSPITITTNVTRVYLLDLSYNRFTSVESPPLNFTQSLDPCALRNVSTLNLSRNAIHVVSPEACLGGVLTLDLSHNQLQTLGALIPVSRVSTFRLNNLYLAGNQLHTVSPETFRTANALRTIDFRFNQFAVVPSLQKLLSNNTFRILYLSGNPLRCDCSAAWLRYTPVGHKIDHARCHSPPHKELFLVQCYNVTSCEANETSATVSYSIPALCAEDTAIVIRDPTADTAGTDVVIQWSVRGPGTISGFRLTYREDTRSKEDTEKLYHPEMRSAVLSALVSGHSYNVCIQADVYPDSRTDLVCLHVEGAAKVSVETMALGIALGLSVLVIIGLVSGLIAKSKRDVSEKARSGETVVRQENVYAHRQREVRNTPSDGSLYENIE